MVISILPLLKGEKDVIPFSYTVSLENVSEDVQSGFGEVTGKIKNFSGYMTLEGEVDMHLQAVCGRCGKCTEHNIKSAFSRPVAVSLTEEDDDYILADENSDVNIDEAVNEAVYMEIPVRFLCNPACKGLCPKCGTDLNCASCSCVEEKGDPRLAKLREYLEKIENED